MNGALDMLHTPAQAMLIFNEYQHTLLQLSYMAMPVCFVMMIGPPQRWSYTSASYVFSSSFVLTILVTVSPASCFADGMLLEIVLTCALYEGLTCAVIGNVCNKYCWSLPSPIGRKCMCEVVLSQLAAPCSLELVRMLKLKASTLEEQIRYCLPSRNREKMLIQSQSTLIPTMAQLIPTSLCRVAGPWHTVPPTLQLVTIFNGHLVMVSNVHLEQSHAYNLLSL